MKAKTIVLVMAGLASAVSTAANLIRDADVAGPQLSSEFRLYGAPSQGGISCYEEEFTFNRCVKLELRQLAVDGAGVTNVNLGLLVGGDVSHDGFPVRGGAKYRFSFEMRGDAPNVIVVRRSWDAQGRATQKATPMGSVKPQKEWTAYKGEMTVPEDAVCGALLFQFWGRLPRYVEYCRAPYYVCLDKFRVEEVTSGREIWPVTALVVPEKGTAEWSDFKSLEMSERPARYPTKMAVAASDSALNFRFAFDGAKPQPNESGVGPWTHDLVELMFGAKEKGADCLHLVLNAAGVKWTNVKGSADSLWDGKSRIRDDGWDAVVSVDWKALGYSTRPPNGSQIRFNAMREHTVERGMKIDPRKGNRCGRGWVLDDSVFSFTAEEFGNPERFGVLILGEDEKYGDDPSAWWAGEQRRKEEERMAKLKSQKFIAAQVPMHTNPEIPYLPPEIFDPQPVFRLRAAVNERTAMPIAVANMTDDWEEYRVTLIRGYEPPSDAWERPMPREGLKRADGKVIGRESFTMRRGVKFRDSNAKQHGCRYDILAKMNEASTLPVPSKEAGLVWVQIDCHGVEPGLYKGELMVTPLSGGQFEKVSYKRLASGTKSVEILDDSKRVPVELEVLPFALDEPTDFALQAFHTGWSDYQVDFMNEYDCIEFIVTPWFFNMTFNPDGSPKSQTLRSFQVPQLKLLRERVKKHGKLPRVMIAYGCYLNFKTFHMRDSGIAYGTPAYWTAWRNWVKFVDRTMLENGFSHDDFVMELYDEPTPQSAPMEEIVRTCKEARAAVPGMKLLNTNGERAFFKAISPLVDQWFFSQHVFGDKVVMEYPKEMLAAGKSVSMYACNTSMRLDLYRYYRILAWKAANIGSDFVSIYQFYDQNPCTSFRQATYGAIAYDTAYEGVPSIRLENLYAGMTDIRYLKLLEKTAKAAGGTPLAKRAIEFAARSLHDVPITYPHDDTGAARFRDTCIEYLIKLK